MKHNFKYLLYQLTIIVWLLNVRQIVLAQNLPKATGPNIVFILVDDLGYSDPSFMGNTYYETPNIDRLSKQGMIFTNAYANAPNCAPTRASLMSGWYAPRHGIYTVGNSDRGRSQDRKLIPIKNIEVLDRSVITLAEVLKSAGYTTAMFGKWHLGAGVGTRPQGQGFDVNVGGNEQGHPHSYFSPYHNPDIKDGPAGEYLTDRLTTEAITFLKEHKSNPFFLYLPFYAVHVPLQAKQNTVEKYKQKTSPYVRSSPVYGAMLDNVDENIGKLLNTINELNLDKNTLIVFTSDNGGFYPVSSAGSLRGNKGMLYEGGIRVPMIVKWPGKIKAGSVNNEPVISMDFFPTFLKVCGIQKPATKILDGVDISPLLYGSGNIQRKALYWHFPAYLEKAPGMKETWRQTPSSAIRKGDWKLIEYFEDGKLELFNLKNDIGEQNEMSTKFPDKVKELKNDLMQWRKDFNAPVPTQLNPEYVAK